MYKEYLLVLVCGHIIGDFYLQSEKIAKKKENKYSWVLLHSMLYSVMILFIPFFIGAPQTVWYGSMAAGVHFIIDSLKYIYTRRLKTKTQRTLKNIFIVDQSMHLISLMVIAFLFVQDEGRLVCTSQTIMEYFHMIKISPQKVLTWVTVLLMIHKPTNILIGTILSGYKPDKENMESPQIQEKRAGRYIGSLERIIMVILISAGQYAAIGLVLTAKSIARYDKITKDPEFSEYYLLGTLLSTLAAIVVSLPFV